MTRNHRHDQDEHYTTGEKMTPTLFVACDACGGPVTMDLAESGISCPSCGWDGKVFARTLNGPARERSHRARHAAVNVAPRVTSGSLPARATCRVCGAPRPPRSVQHGDPYCSRTCCEKGTGTYERAERRRRMLASRRPLP